MGQLLLAVLLMAAIAQSPVASIAIYPSGYAHVAICEPVTASYQVNISLIGRPEGLTASYSNGSPVPYTVSNGSVLLTPDANGTVCVNYYTFSIIIKNPIAWSANFTTPYAAELILPYNSSLVYMNSAPAGASVVNDTLILDLTPGHWDVSYVMPPPSTAPPPIGVPGRPSSAYTYWDIVAVAAIAAVAVAVVAAIRMGRGMRRWPSTARDPDDRIIEFLRRSGGSATEAEIRRALVIPKTTCWRAIKRLEREGKVRIEKRDKENVVHLG